MFHAHTIINVVAISFVILSRVVRVNTPIIGIQQRLFAHLKVKMVARAMEIIIVELI